MILKRNRELGEYLFILYAGEYFASPNDIMISTVLGSCVAVCLYDEENGVGGLNHFMLPENVQLSESSRIYTRDTKYGIHAMDMLINAVLKKGAQKENLQAKIFGGATYVNGNSDIGKNNVRFAEKYLYLEDIKLISKDDGGTEARKLFFYPKTGKVFLKRIYQSEYIEKIEALDREYMKKSMRELEEKSGFIDLEEFF